VLPEITDASVMNPVVDNYVSKVLRAVVKTAVAVAGTGVLSVIGFALQLGDGVQSERESSPFVPLGVAILFNSNIALLHSCYLYSTGLVRAAKKRRKMAPKQQHPPREDLLQPLPYPTQVPFPQRTVQCCNAGLL
jgi:hypothetical protein